MAKPKAKTGAKRPTGRPTIYSDKLAQAFCSRVKAGESVRSVCLDPKMPNRSTVYRWLEEDRGTFKDQYARALEVQSDNSFDELEALAQRAIDERDKELTNAVRLMIDTRKWILSKKLPKKYGDRQTIEHQGGVTFTAPSPLDD